MLRDHLWQCYASSLTLATGRLDFAHRLSGWWLDWSVI